MKVTGYELQLQIKDLKREVESLATQFDNGKTRFNGEEKLTAVEAYDLYRKTEDQLALAQTLQAVYNNKVKVTVQGTTMTLARAIRLIGGAGRGEAMWRAVVAPKKDRYLRDDTTRDKDKEYASTTYTLDQARTLAKQSANFASALRQAIQEANAKAVEISEDEL